MLLHRLDTLPRCRTNMDKAPRRTMTEMLRLTEIVAVSSLPKITSMREKMSGLRNGGTVWPGGVRR
jgi:hypothetical protein